MRVNTWLITASWRTGNDVVTRTPWRAWHRARMPTTWGPATGASWLNEPAHHLDGDDLVVEAAEGSDLWRTTSYGFVRDSGHALLAPLPPGSSATVSFVADLPELYDQAGVLVRVDESTWAKAGLETSDGATQLGAVVTHETSDWSMAPVPAWSGQTVTLRVSRTGDALVFRARTTTEPWRMLRVSHLDAGATASAGPFCCAPSRAGLTVRFTAFSLGAPDVSLHDPAIDEA